MSFNCIYHKILCSDTTVFNSAADAVAMVDEVFGIPELFHLEESVVVVTEVPLGERGFAHAERRVHVVCHSALFRHKLISQLSNEFQRFRFIFFCQYKVSSSHLSLRTPGHVLALVRPLLVPRVEHAHHLNRLCSISRRVRV